MKLAVVGSRDYNNTDLIADELQGYLEDYPDLVIISGGAKGVDRFAEKWANRNGVPTEIFKPDWDTHGRSAGMIRNAEIIANAEGVLAFWDGTSSGTWNTIERALSAKHLYFVEVYCGEARPTTLYSVSTDRRSFKSAIRNNAHHHINIVTPEWAELV